MQDTAELQEILPDDKHPWAEASKDGSSVCCAWCKVLKADANVRASFPDLHVEWPMLINNESVWIQKVGSHASTRLHHLATDLHERGILDVPGQHAPSEEVLHEVCCKRVAMNLCHCFAIKHAEECSACLSILQQIVPSAAGSRKHKSTESCKAHLIRQQTSTSRSYVQPLPA